jgi:hypothetical protein
MPFPGKTINPAGMTESISSLRRNGRGLGVLRPVRLEGDLRHLAGFSPAGGDAFGAFWRAAVQQHHVGMLGMGLIELRPDPLVVVDSPCRRRKAIFVPAGISTSVSARRRAERKSRLSIIVAVMLAWLTLEPVRGRQADPVCASNRSDA